MSYTLGEAARAVGKSKGTISKAIKSGKISAVKQENGSFRIEAAELHRVYPPVSGVGERPADLWHWVDGQSGADLWQSLHRWHFGLSRRRQPSNSA